MSYATLTHTLSFFAGWVVGVLNSRAVSSINYQQKKQSYANSSAPGFFSFFSWEKAVAQTISSNIIAIVVKLHLASKAR